MVTSRPSYGKRRRNTLNITYECQILYSYVRHHLIKCILSVSETKKGLDGSAPKQYVPTPIRAETDMPDILDMLDQLCDSLLQTKKPDRPLGSRNDLHGSTQEQYVTRDVISVGGLEKEPIYRVLQVNWDEVHDLIKYLLGGGTS